MSGSYRYNHKSAKHRRVFWGVLAVFLLIVGAGAAAIILDLQQSQSGQVEGVERVVGQVQGTDATTKTINEPLFSLSLPSDWKEVRRTNVASEHSIEWQATKKNADNRTLKLYIDTIPANLPVNRLLPVSVQDNHLSAGDVSDNCATFTQGGTLDAAKASKLAPTSARWQGVDFICNLPNVVDDQVGTGSHDGINQVTVNGPTQGTHKYFFLYTDHNIQPDYSILDDVISSFQAK